MNKYYLIHTKLEDPEAYKKRIFKVKKENFMKSVEGVDIITDGLRYIIPWHSISFIEEVLAE